MTAIRHEDGDECPLDLGRRFDELLSDLAEKHRQNRNDIHQLRNEQQKLALKHSDLEGILAPITGKDGKKGVLDTLIAAVDSLRNTVESLNLSRAEQAGIDKQEQKTTKRDRFLIGSGLALIVALIPFLVVLIQRLFPAGK